MEICGMGYKKTVYQFKVSLLGISPPIWRMIQIRRDYSFWDLHVGLQDAMGWLDSHLHLFRIINPVTGDLEEIGIPNEELFEDEHPCIAGWAVPISAYFADVGSRADYDYDFGDCWEHEVIVEDIVDLVAEERYPKCVAGARACPPEDCGGIWGYEELLRTIGDPSHKEYESTMQWLGGSYDPEVFDAKKVRFDNPRKRWETAFGGA